MAKLLKILSINAGVMFLLLLAPAVFFQIYKHIKLSSLPPPPSQDLKNNPAYPDKKDQDIAERMGKDQEQGSSYRSFIGWRRKPFLGNYKNVQPPYNTRLSVNNSIDDSVWFFGGSTMWGSGAIDSETIPSWYARKTGKSVFNLGETAWVSRQSLNQLVNLLGDSRSAQGVVFYDGVNDILHGCRIENETVPAHLQEKSISKALETDAFDYINASLTPVKNYLLAPYKALAAKFGLKVSKPRGYGAMDCSTDKTKAAKVAAHLVNNWFSAYSISKQKGINFIAILQPQVFSSAIKKDYLHPGDNYLQAEYLSVYPLIKQQIDESCKSHPDFCSHVIDGSTWLDTKPAVYIDFCHLTGKGNQIIADRISKIF